MVSIAYIFLLKSGILCPFTALSAGILSSLILFDSCILPKHLWVHLCTSPFVSGRHKSLGIIHQLWASQYFCFLFYIDTWAWRKEFDEDTSLVTKCPKISHFCTLYDCRSVCCLQSTEWRNFSDNNSMIYSNMGMVDYW